MHEAVDIALQQVVHHDDGRVQHFEDVTDRKAESLRNVVDIQTGHPPQDRAVEEHVEFEEDAIDRLDRVRNLVCRVAGGFRGGGAAHQYGRHQHRSGKRSQAFAEFLAQQLHHPIPSHVAPMSGAASSARQSASLHHKLIRPRRCV